MPSDPAPRPTLPRPCPFTVAGDSDMTLPPAPAFRQGRVTVAPAWLLERFNTPRPCPHEWRAR